jgi:hypothetical protein
LQPTRHHLLLFLELQTATDQLLQWLFYGLPGYQQLRPEPLLHKVKFELFESTHLRIPLWILRSRKWQVDNLKSFGPLQNFANWWVNMSISIVSPPANSRSVEGSRLDEIYHFIYFFQ